MNSERQVETERYALIRPFGLAGNRWESLASAVLCAALISVFALEVLTPDDVVGFLGLLPLVTAMWLLSRKPASLIGLVAATLFVLTVTIEVSNRATLLYEGATTLVIACAVRWYASNIASLIGRQRAHRQTDQFVRAWTSTHPGYAPGFDSLSRRELEVARLASSGYRAREIGDLLHISERTVESHLASVYAKLGINSKPALIKMSARLGEG